MATKLELIKYIRFQLNQLSSENKYFEFEGIAKEFSKKRICKNILPATGPVSAGGDQGRDFETYYTFINSLSTSSKLFLGKAENNNIVFACTLQKNIPPKIKSDIKKIVSGEQEVNFIYFFCEDNVPISKRHELQGWSLEKYNVKLEIFDGLALSELLAETDTFWIAEEFLEVPSDMYPPPTNESKEYSTNKQKWLIDNNTPYSYADFFQIKYGIRKATYNNNLKADLPKWITKISTYLER